MEQLSINQKKEEILDNEEDICDHCIGRQFAKLGHGLENYERAQIIKNKDGEELKEEDFDPENVPGNYDKVVGCQYCGEVLQDVKSHAEQIMSSWDRYELETFLVGIRVPKDLLAKEEELWSSYGTEWTETLKTELSRLIGKQIEKETDLKVDFKRADINAVLDLQENKRRVELQVNSVLFYGRYNKYSRELPQTVWNCRKCFGSGCERCDWKGKMYDESVQEIIQEPFMRETKAIEAKFHGNGREDIDAKCLGKREFVLELIEPLNRDLDPEKLQKEINESQEKVDVFEMAETYKDKVEEVKETRTQKEYRATVETSKEVTEEDLEKLDRLIGTLQQRTPERVEQRRADKIREREVYEIDYEKEPEKTNQFKLFVKAEAGTYIKEMISSDNGRTEPSVAKLLDCDAECTALDVVWIEKIGNN